MSFSKKHSLQGSSELHFTYNLLPLHWRDVMKVLGLTFGGLRISSALSSEDVCFVVVCLFCVFFSVSTRFVGILTLLLFYKNTETGLLNTLMPTILYSAFHWKWPSEYQILCPSVTAGVLCSLGWDVNGLWTRRAGLMDIRPPRAPPALSSPALSGNGLAQWQNQRKSSHSGEKRNVKNN